MALQSFGKDIRAAVFGASGGIGSAFVDALAADPAIERVFAVSRGELPERAGVMPLRCDPGDENDLAIAAEQMQQGGPLHLVIVAIGMLHGDGIGPEKSLRQIDGAAMQRIIAVNTVTPCLIAKHMLPLLASDRKTGFAALSARVGSISDNRLGGWISYRASKAALNMALRTLSIEMARTRPQAVVIGLHPGTVDTGLSEPFQSNVPDGKLFTAGDSVARMLKAVDAVTPQQSGSVFAHDGERIDP